MAQTEDPSLQVADPEKPEGETARPEEDSDSARERSLQLGGGLPIGAKLGSYVSFLGEVREEMRKVTWPTRKQAITETIVVIAVVIFFTSLITGLDNVLAVIFNWLLFGKALPWQSF